MECSDTQIQQRRIGMLFNTPLPRYTPSNPYIDNTGMPTGITQEQLNMRRKVEILKYNKQNTQTNRPTRARTFAQRMTGRYNIQQGTDLNGILCPTDSSIRVLSTSANIPGPPIELWEDKNVPLYNYVKNVNGYGDQIYSVFNEYTFKPHFNVELQRNNTEIGMLYIDKDIETNYTTFNYKIPISLYISGTNIDIGNANKTFEYTGLNSLITTVGMFYNDTQIAQPITYNVKKEFLNNISFSFPPDSNILENVLVPGTFDFIASVYIGYIDMQNILLTTEPGYVYTVQHKINSNKITTTNSTNSLDTLNISFNIICNIEQSIKIENHCIINTTIPSPFQQISFSKA